MPALLRSQVSASSEPYPFQRVKHFALLFHKAQPRMEGFRRTADSLSAEKWLDVVDPGWFASGNVGALPRDGEAAKAASLNTKLKTEYFKNLVLETYLVGPRRRTS